MAENIPPSEPKPPDSTHRRSSGQAGLTSFWKELRRRHVVRVAITYAVVAWLIIQIAASTFEGFGIPDWAFRFVVIMVILGFPIAVLLAWAFELTPEGIKTTKTAKVQHPDSHEDKSHVKKRHWFSLGMAAAVPTLIFGVLAIYFYATRSAPFEPELTSTEEIEEIEKSIAVLPLENMSPDPDNAFFVDGVQEDILTNLSKIADLDKVISRSSTLKFRDPDRNMRAVGEELSVRYVVEGSVRRSGDQVRVTVQLIDCETDNHVWAETYDRTLDDIFAIQAEVALTIANQLKAVLSPKEVAQIDRRPTQNQEAYDSYIKFRNLIISGERSEDARNKKINYLEQAVSHDPEFAEAWSRLAIECIYYWDFGNRKDPKLRTRAYEAMEQARRHGPDLADIPFALSSFSFREQRDPEASIRYLLQVISIDSKFPSAHWRLGSRYSHLGRLAEAQHHLELELSIDPAGGNPNYWLVEIYNRRAMWGKAYALIEKNEKRTADDIWITVAYETRYLQTGAKDAFRKAIESHPNYSQSPIPKIRSALMARDYASALIHSKSYESDRGISYLRFRIEPVQLAEALIRFLQDDEYNSLVEAQSARIHLREIIDENPKAKPTNWSQVAICYALESKSEQMELAMAEAREISNSSYYRYDYKAVVEMHIAIAYIILGDEEKAIETLEAASKMDSPIFLNRELDLWFIFDRLRGNPRFEALLKG